MLLAAADSAAPVNPWTIWIPVIVAAIALAGVMGTLWQKWRSDRAALRQKTEADRREAWWDRTQWALEQVLEKGTNRTNRAIGLTVLQNLIVSDIATEADGVMLDEICDLVLNGRAP